MSEQGYNGWTNYETWVTKLWIDNDQGEQEYWMEQAREILETAGPTTVLSREENARFQLADSLKEAHETNAEELIGTTTGLFSDLLTSALGRVNWDEIAAAMIEDAKEGY